MATEKSDPRIRLLPLENATSAPDGLCCHYKDRWWIYDEASDSVVFWKPDRRSNGFPQCNTNEDVARHLAEKLYPWADVRFIPSVFIKANPQDYV